MLLADSGKILLKKSRRREMTQSAWPVFIDTCKNRHLIVVDVPVDVAKDPLELIALLIDLVNPKGDFALRAEKTALGTRLFCAFAEAVDVDMVVQATDAQEDNVYSGWASEYHCRLDRTAAEAIRGAATVLEPTPPRLGSAPPTRV
jgi:hypothetical protein